MIDELPAGRNACAERLLPLLAFARVVSIEKRHGKVLSALAKATTAILLVTIAFVWPVSAKAGILWECVIQGEVISEPTLEDEHWHMVFQGTHFKPQAHNFCQDLLNRSEGIKLSTEYYSRLGYPEKGATIRLKEFKEENDFGQGLMQWRFFNPGTW